MITKEQRENELYKSGLVDTVKGLFAGKNVNISEEYYVLIADYIDSLDEVKDSMKVNVPEIAKRLPNVISNIVDIDLGGAYGETNGDTIEMNGRLGYEDKKLYFFHELTHALQTRDINGNEQCAFYNGHDGMFLTEATTQYTAEILYHVSNGTNIKYENQLGRVRGDKSRTTYSPLSEYQYNGNVLMLLCKSMDLPLPQVLGLAYNSNCRETIKNIYEGMIGNEGKFNELMNDLEKIYSIDKLLIYGYGPKLQSKTPLNFFMQDKSTAFKGNLDIYKELMDKTEKGLVENYIRNHETQYVVQNQDDIGQYLTKPSLKKEFMFKVLQLGQKLHAKDMVQEDTSERYQYDGMDQFEGMNQNSEINQYGEIIREPIETKPSFKQTIAMYLRNNKFFMKIPFLKNFADKQLNILPQAKTEERITNNNTRQEFVNYISNNGEYRNSSQVQAESKKQDLKERSNEDNELDL